MTVTAISNATWHGAAHNAENELGQSVRRWTVWLITTAIIGAVAGLGGLIIAVVSLVEPASVARPLTPIGTFLIVISFLAWVAAAHCVDKVDSIEKAIRLEYCHRNGLERSEEQENS